MAERRVQDLFDKILFDVKQSLSRETDPTESERIRQGNYFVGDYIGHISLQSRNSSISQDYQRLMQLDMQKYHELAMINCAKLLYPHTNTRAERRAQNLFDNIIFDVEQSLSREADPIVSERIRQGNYFVGDYIGQMSLQSRNSSISQDYQRLMELDMQKYHELAMINCAKLLYPHTNTRLPYRAEDTNPYTI